MRRGNQGKAVHRLKDGSLLGVNLGADYTAEHEWGISDLLDLYGVEDEQEGIDRRIIRRAPRENILFDAVRLKLTDYSGKKPKATTSTWWGLVSLSRPAGWPGFDTLSEDTVKSLELWPYGDADIHGAWDGGSFGLLSQDESLARELSEAIERLDICLGLFGGGGNPFGRAGLCLLIASRIPQAVQDAWLENDRDGRRLEAAAEATGVAQRLKEAGRRYHALSPKWASEIKSTKGGEVKTKHPVIYWLNPEKQDLNNYGWFTVEQLDQWIDGRGPIPKTV